MNRKTGSGFLYRVFIVIGLISAFYFGTAISASPPLSSPSQGTIVAAGNSLTAGLGVAESEAYPALLEKKLYGEGLDYRVINAGISGETSSGLRSRIKWLLTLKPDIVIVETGANDGMRGIDLTFLRDNIRYIIQVLLKHNVIPVLVGMKMFPSMGPDYAESFSRIYPEIATEEGIILMPFFLKAVAGKPAYNLADGIHPNPKGYRIITNNLYPYVLDAIRKLDGSK
jgi:acyl-CoA thioesterase-1